MVRRPIEPDYLTDRLGGNLDGMLAEYAVVTEPPLLGGSRDVALCSGDGVGGADGPSPGDRRRYGLDPGFGRCVRLCPAIRPGVLGARVIAMTSTAKKAERLRGLARPSTPQSPLP